MRLDPTGRIALSRPPTPKLSRDGLAAQDRTRGVLGVSAALAVTTGLLAAFTNWDGGPEATGLSPAGCTLRF